MIASSGEGTAEGASVSRSDPHGIVEWGRRIYADGMHNAWPDIAYWRGNYYVVFTRGTAHNTEGVGMVLRSSNLRDWEHIYTTSSSSLGGDCKLLALPERLMLYYVVYHDPQHEGDVETQAVYTEDGQNWSEPQRVYEPRYNFWGPKVHNGLIYVAADIEEDNLQRVELLRSADGLAWEKVSTIVEGSQSQVGGKVTETAIAFWPDGELWALTRQNILSRARPPYTNWTNEPAFPEGNPWIGGPGMIRIGNDIYAAGRTYPVVAVSDKYDGRATSLWKSDQGTHGFEWIADLPKAAHTDTGYAGFVATEEGVYVVYYSGHAYEEEEAHMVKTDIYLVKLNIARGDLHP